MPTGPAWSDAWLRAAGCSPSRPGRLPGSQPSGLGAGAQALPGAHRDPEGGGRGVRPAPAPPGRRGEGPPRVPRPAPRGGRAPVAARSPRASRPRSVRTEAGWGAVKRRRRWEPGPHPERAGEPAADSPRPPSPQRPALPVRPAARLATPRPDPAPGCSSLEQVSGRRAPRHLGTGAEEVPRGARAGRGAAPGSPAITPHRQLQGRAGGGQSASGLPRATPSARAPHPPASWRARRNEDGLVCLLPWICPPPRLAQQV